MNKFVITAVGVALLASPTQITPYFNPQQTRKGTLYQENSLVLPEPKKNSLSEMLSSSFGTKTKSDVSFIGDVSFDQKTKQIESVKIGVKVSS